MFDTSKLEKLIANCLLDKVLNQLTVIGPRERKIKIEWQRLCQSTWLRLLAIMSFPCWLLWLEWLIHLVNVRAGFFHRGREWLIPKSLSTLWVLRQIFGFFKNCWWGPCLCWMLWRIHPYLCRLDVLQETRFLFNTEFKIWSALSNV